MPKHRLQHRQTPPVRPSAHRPTTSRTRQRERTMPRRTPTGPARELGNQKLNPGCAPPGNRSRTPLMMPTPTQPTAMDDGRTTTWPQIRVSTLHHRLRPSSEQRTSPVERPACPARGRGVSKPAGGGQHPTAPGGRGPDWERTAPANRDPQPWTRVSGWTTPQIQRPLRCATTSQLGSGERPCVHLP